MEPFSPQAGARTSASVTKRYTPLVHGAAGGSDAADLFFDALHRRVVDRVGWPWARSWLAAHSRLEPCTASGWPALRLVFTAAPPPEASGFLLRRHFRDAMTQGCKSGPLADLGASLEMGQ
jgi:hypothetical protein